MKKFNDIQCLIKNKNKICLFVDYENVIKKFSLYSGTGLLGTREVRIANNFFKSPFIFSYLIINDNVSKKCINFLKKNFKDATVISSEEETINEILKTFDDTYTSIYIGSDINIIQSDNFKNGYTISLDDSDNSLDKIVDFKFSKHKFEELLIETNNICL